MKVVVPIPVLGRFPLLRLTIKRLYEKNKVFKVILIGDELETKQIADEMDCEYVLSANKPLGFKWNNGFKAAKKYNPDAVLFAGSSDWISDDYIQIASQYLDRFDMIGKNGCHFIDKSKGAMRLVWWAGYDPRQRNETIGIGRLLSGRILNKFNYMPFNNAFDHSLDYSMNLNIIRNKGKIKILEPNQGSLLSISTDKWGNKHNFNEHWNNTLPSEKMPLQPFIKQFPEIHEL